MRPNNLKVADPFIADFREACSNFPDPKLSRCRGNTKARILLIAPAPEKEDMQNNVPFVHGAAQKFHGNLRAHANIDTESDCLVMPGSVLPKRMSKLLVLPFKSLTLKYYSRFNVIFCVGGDTFKFIFGDGKKSSMQTLSNGFPLYLPPLIGKVPLFVLPDIRALDPDWENIPENDHWQAKIAQDRCQKWLNRILPKIGDFVQKIYKK